MAERKTRVLSKGSYWRTAVVGWRQFYKTKAATKWLDANQTDWYQVGGYVYLNLGKGDDNKAVVKSSSNAVNNLLHAIDDFTKKTARDQAVQWTCIGKAGFDSDRKPPRKRQRASSTSRSEDSKDDSKPGGGG